MDYDTAVQLLNSSVTWCQGARTLAKLGDRRALIPLIRAYLVPTEASKLCLLKAMKALEAELSARELYESGDKEDRRLAIYLMGLFPDEGHLSYLESALIDPDPSLQEQARHSLTLQLRTPKWHEIIRRQKGTAFEVTTGEGGR